MPNFPLSLSSLNILSDHLLFLCIDLENLDLRNGGVEHLVVDDLSKRLILQLFA